MGKTGFPTKKDIEDNKQKAQVSEDQLQKFLDGAKDVQIDIDDKKESSNLETSSGSNAKEEGILEIEKKVKFHETHKTASYLLRNDIAPEINKLARKGGKGWKTKFINDALIAHLLRYGINLPEYK